MNEPIRKPFEDFLQKEINLKQLDLIWVNLPQQATFKSGIGLRKSKKTLIIKWTNKDGYVGYGECSCRPDPYYSAEFLDAAGLLVEQFIFPILLKCQTYGALLEALDRIRGWYFTKAAIDFSVHDMIRNREGRSLFDHWSRTKIGQIPAGISIGIGASLETTKRQITQALGEGYRRLKFKTSSTFDTIGFSKLGLKNQEIPLLFDANGTLSWKDISLLGRLADLGAVVEQPFPPGRLDWSRSAKEEVPNLKLCLDESIKDIGILKAAYDLGAIDELNLKPSRVGGILKAIEMTEFCFENNIPVWIGGMFETGIGRLLNLQFASFLPQAIAHDLSPSKRYFVEDILKEPIEMGTDGHINLANLNLEIDQVILEKYTEKRTVLR